MDQQQHSHWRNTARRVLWIVGVVVSVSTVLFVINHFFVHRALWDWLKLLIVPVVIGGGGLWFNRQQQERQQADNQRQQERGLEVESQHAQDAALQAYLDQLSQLLLDKNKPLSETQPGDNLRVVARARTLTILPSLDRGRKANILQFLYEAHLISRGHNVVSLKGAFLSEAYLGEAHLSGADLNGARLRGAYLVGATLIEANLDETYLGEADLSNADLRGASLLEAKLFGASLDHADLSEAYLSAANLNRARLRGAYLIGAELIDADLGEADLTHADLSEADLTGAQVTYEQLAKCRTLENATMPNGQKYEDWLEDDKKGRERN